jgi:hypothetical protein
MTILLLLGLSVWSDAQSVVRSSITSLTAGVTGTLPVANGGTNSSTALSGSSIVISNGTGIVQGSAGTTTTVLHGNASGAPTYGAVTLTTDVTGTLPVSNGGTGVTSASALRNLSTAVSALSDGATPALDASLGNVFTLSAAGNRTIAVPTNPTSGQKIIIQHYASGADRTLSLNTGAGGFRYGTDITGLTATTSGKTDYIGAIYNATDSKWDVVAYVKGY